MLARILCVALACAVAPAAQAQQWGEIAYYLAWLGPEDMRNSSGTRLTSAGAVLQQDRANYHRFGLRHARDEGDPVFANRSQRARIPSLYVQGGGLGSVEAAVAAGRPIGVGVFVCGYGATPSVIHLAPFGSDHSGCF